jgi:uncharacterized membrane protein YqgA involved in biofilm formation
MIATIINALTVIIGSLIGYLLRRGLSEDMKKVVFTSAGVITVALGLQSALEIRRIHIPYSFALILGGILGTWLRLEDNIENLGSEYASSLSEAGRCRLSAGLFWKRA